MKKKLTSKIAGLIFIVVIISVLYIVAKGFGRISSLDFGAGAFYYTDIPDWRERFFGKESVNTGTKHIYIFLIAFILWGYICIKALLWLDKK